MIIKVLGAIDIFTGLVFWVFGIMGIGNSELILLLGLILLIKGIVFMTSMNLISLGDIVVGLIIIYSGGAEVVMPRFVVIIIALFLLQKGAFSMVG